MWLLGVAMGSIAYIHVFVKVLFDEFADQFCFAKKREGGDGSNPFPPLSASTGPLSLVPLPAPGDPEPTAQVVRAFDASQGRILSRARRAPLVRLAEGLLLPQLLRCHLSLCSFVCVEENKGGEGIASPAPPSPLV